MKWVETLRLSLLISLSLLFVYILARRFKQRVLAKDLPVPLHAELLALHVMYHPMRLWVQVRMPSMDRLTPRMLDGSHAVLHSWPEAEHPPGEIVFELALADRPDGDYFLELSSASQRTVRKFTLDRG